jgi:hypothetical protein
MYVCMHFCAAGSLCNTSVLVEIEGSATDRPREERQWSADAAEQREHVAFAKAATKWLTVRDFESNSPLVTFKDLWFW